MERKEGRGSLGSPTSREQERTQKESKELQLLPSVWNYLERRMTLKNHPRGLEFDKEKEELESLEDEINENGTDRDRFILELYDKVRCEPSDGRKPEQYRSLSLEEFREFRSEVEKMSDKELEKLLPPKEPKFPSLVHGEPHIVWHDEDIDD